MAKHSSAIARDLSNTSGRNISKSLKRRAQSVINDKSIDAESRALIRYGLETNDPWLAELVRRVDAGETLIDNWTVSETPQTSKDDSPEEKIDALAELICRAGDEPAIKSAALLVLMSALENARHPRALANAAKHFAFTQCAELDLCGMVDAQIAAIENELLAGNALVS